MLVRTLAVLAIVTGFGSGLVAQENAKSAQVGDRVAIRMTGDLAKEYARLTGSLRGDEAPSGRQVEVIGTIAQGLDDGRVRIKHSSSIKRDGQSDRLITLMATIESTRITAKVTPKGTRTFASPADHQRDAKAVVTKADNQTFRLQLSELKNLKLRTWALAEEVGD